MWAVMSPQSSFFQRKMVKAFEDIEFIGVSRDPAVGISFDELLESPRLTKVYVCTPTLTHGRIVQQLLEANKDVLVEKGWWGPKIDPHDAIRLAKSRGLSLDIAYQPTYARSMRELCLLGEWDSATVKFTMPIPKFPTAFEDVGFYPVMTMLTLGGENAQVLSYSDTEGSAMFKVVGADRTTLWNLEFGLGSEFSQEIVFHHQGQHVYTLDEPFVSRTDLDRYANVVSEFDKLQKVSHRASLFPKLRKILENWKRVVNYR